MTILTDNNYVDKAEKVIKGLPKRYDKWNDRELLILTTSKIRTLLALTSNLFDESKAKTFEELSEKFSYLRVQFVYQSGREKSVKDFVESAQILEILKEIQTTKDIAYLRRFCRYMEALVAYFKYEGGKD